MRYIRLRILDLLFGQGTARPIRKAHGFVKLDSQQFLHQILVTDRFAKAANHCRRLRIEDGSRRFMTQVVKNFDILMRGVEYFDHVFVLHQIEKRLQIQSVRQRIDARRFVP